MSEQPLDGVTAGWLIASARLNGGISELARTETGELCVAVTFEHRHDLTTWMEHSTADQFEHQRSYSHPTARWRVIVEP